MKSESARRIRLVYGILLSASAVVAGICLMAACIGIYNSGGSQIYTPDKVAAAFAPIAGPVYLCLALIIGGFILDFALPCEKKKIKPEKNYAAILNRLMEKRDMDTCDAELKSQIQAQQALRKRDAVICYAVLAVCSIGFLCYGANPANFHQSQINGSMIKAVSILFCCLAVPFGSALGAAYRAKKSLQAEIELVKQIPAGEKKKAVSEKKTIDGVLIARCVLVCAAVALLLYGFFAGGTADVLTKAVNICTECVGLG